MTLQASGAISLADIAAEFGGAAPHSLSEYYRGGGLVPNTPANAGIPTSGAISLSDFYGGDASVGTVQVTSPVNITRFNSLALCTAGIVFQTNGGLDEMGPNTGDISAHGAGEWWSEEPDVGIGASYDVRCASISSGAWNVAAAATGTWVNMSTQRVWRVTVTAMAAPDLEQCTAVFEIRPAGGGAVLDTFTVTCQASN